MEKMTNPPSESEDTITFKRSHFYSIMVVFAFAAGILVGYLAWGRSQPVQQVVAAPEQAPPDTVAQPEEPEEPSFTRYEIPTEGFPSIGPEDAEIVIVEFSDYQWPFCKRWRDQTYEPLLAAYPGQIRLVYRNLPLESIHPEAFSAAVAALCAGEQGAYWPYHDKLFSYELELGQDAYLQYATDLELDVTALETCLDSGKYDDFIREDMAFSGQLGVRSTPTFFINGLALVGAQPLSAFQQIIDKELAGEIPE